MMSKPRMIVLITVASLVVVTVIAVLLANLGVFGTEAAKSPLAKWGPGGILVEIVGLFTLIGRRAFKPERQLSIVIGPPDELPRLEISRINWNRDKCHLVRRDGREIPIRLVSAGKGALLEVDLPEEESELLETERLVELKLLDDKNNRWSVKPFRPWLNVRPLTLMESKDKIISDYGEPG